jgi:hypothetical protein
MSVTVANARARLLKYFYWNYKASIEQPLLAAASVGLVAMGLMFLLGAVVSIPLALLGASWGVESIALLVLMSGSLTTVAVAIMLLRHNRRCSQDKRKYSLSIGERVWEIVCTVASSLFCGACSAVVSLTVAYWCGVMLLLFWPGPIGWQRQLLVYPPVIVGIPAFAVGTVGFLIHEWWIERNWRKRIRAHSSH